MRVHPTQKIEALKNARRQGSSILELVRKFNIPKTTIWHHIHDIKLSKAQTRKLRSNQGGSLIRYQMQVEKARKEARKIIQSITNFRQISPLIISLLYWAEGNKKGFIFTNTDEDMIRLFLSIVRSYFGVRNNHIIVMARIARHADSQRVKLYWKKVTGVPIKNIRTDVNRHNNKSRAKYGICRIRVNKGGYLSKLVKCLNEELTSAVISSNI